MKSKIKLYELIVFISFCLFVLFSNLYTPNIEKKSNGKDIKKGINIIERDCYSEIDPCICKKEKRLTRADDCADIPSLISIEDIKFINSKELSSDAFFHYMVNAAYREYFYTHFMEITQISFMKYLNTDGFFNLDIETTNKPHYLFYLGIEYLKQGNYDESLKYLSKFIDISIDYEKYKKNIYNFSGCCEKDLLWVKNINHSSYDMAKIIKNMINEIIDSDNKSINKNLLKTYFNKLKEFDTTPDTIDLIDNIIFSTLISIKDNAEITNYKIELLKKYQKIQLNNFADPFNKINGNFLLSSQIDIVVMLRILECDTYINSLADNRVENSIHDIKAIRKHMYLINKYFNKPYDYYLTLIREEGTKIKNKYNIVKKSTKTEDFIDLENLDAIDFKTTITDAEVDFWESSLKRSNNIIKNIETKNNYLSTLNMDTINASIEKRDYFSLNHYIIDFDNFIQSIDYINYSDHFPPKIKHNYYTYIKSLHEDIKYDELMNDEYYQYFNQLSKKEITLSYQNDYNSLYSYWILLGLNKKNSYGIIKVPLEIYYDEEDISHGAKIFTYSLDYWSR